VTFQTWLEQGNRQFIIAVIWIDICTIGLTLSSWALKWFCWPATCGPIDYLILRSTYGFCTAAHVLICVTFPVRFTPRFKVTLISLSMLFMIYHFSLRLLGCPLSFSLSNAFAHFHRQSSCPVSSPSGRVAAVVMQRLTILFRFQLGSNSFCTLFSVHLLVSCATDHPSSHCYSIISF
jgi:hypothetical protein